MKRAPIWLLLLLAAWLAPLVGQAQSPRVVHLVYWSDIHSGGRHYDSEVWETARDEGLDEKPDAIVMLGDQCDNSHDRDAFWTRLRSFLQEFAQDMKEVTTPILLTLGNDDLQLNYQSDKANLDQAYKVFHETLGQRYYLDELGNGVYPGRPAGMVWISLDSIIFSQYNKYPGAPEQARTSLAWLEQRLREAGSTPVVILVHIPPTWDLHSRKPAWKSEYLRELNRLLLAHQGSVTILAGHYHRNTVQAFARPQGNVPVLIGGSLANKFGYIPNWRTYRWTLDAQGAPERIEYDVRYPEHPSWKHHYDVRPAHLQDFLDHIKDDEAFYRSYLLDVYGHHLDFEDWAEVPEVREAVLDEFWVQP